MTTLILALAFVFPASAGHGVSEMARGREAGVRFLGCELLSLSRILAEVSARLQLVDSESAYLRNEARDLSAERRADPAGRAELRLAEREVWRAAEGAQALDSARAEAVRALERAQGRWRAFKKALDKDLSRRGDGQKAAPEADRAAAAAAEAGVALGRAAAALRAAQDLLDGALALSGAGIRPWHHNYRANGMTRPDYRLDFAAEWEAQLEKAHHELHTDWRR